MFPNDGHPDFVNGSHLRGVTNSLGHLLFTCRSGTARHSTAQQSSGTAVAVAVAGPRHSSAADSRLFSPSLPYQLAVREREKGKQTWNPSIHRIPPPIASPILHPPPSPPHLRSYPRERLGTGNKTEHDAELEGRIEMGMGINHVWSTTSHASRAKEARAEEARAEEARTEEDNRSRSRS